MWRSPYAFLFPLQSDYWYFLIAILIIGLTLYSPDVSNRQKSEMNDVPQQTITQNKQTTKQQTGEVINVPQQTITQIKQTTKQETG